MVLRTTRTKRGILFSLISVLISGFILLLFWNANSPRLDQLSDAIDTRVSVMDRHLGSWDAYVADATRLSVRQALLGLTDRIETYVDNGALSPNPASPYSLSQVTRNLSRCLRTGSSDFVLADIGIPGEGYCFTSIDASLAAKLDNFTALTEEALRLKTTYTFGESMLVEDWAPFQLHVRFTINMTLEDDVFATWNRSKQYDIIVNVEGLPDPLFAYYAYGTLLPGSRRRNITEFSIPRDRLNRTQVEQLLAEGFYVENLDMGPTYLQRLRGMTRPLIGEPFDPDNRSGIETLIIPAETDPGFLSSSRYQNTSFTANQLFAGFTSLECGNASSGTFGITNFSDHDFYLDVPHLIRYGFNGSSGSFNYSSCN